MEDLYTPKSNFKYMEQKFAEKRTHTQVDAKLNQTKQKVTVFQCPKKSIAINKHTDTQKKSQNQVKFN